jgi:HK97 family phage portal protein
MVYLSQEGGELRTITREDLGLPPAAGIMRSSHVVDTYWRHYRDHPFVHAAITEQVQALIGIPLVGEQYIEESRTWVRVDESHDLARLLRSPNSELSQTAFFERLYTELCVTGDLYAWKRRARSGHKIIEFVPAKSKHMRAVEGTGTELIRGYEYDSNADFGTGRQCAEAQTFPSPTAKKYDKRDVIHVLLSPDPDYPLKGLAPMESALADIDLDYAITEFTTALMERGAVVDHALITKNPVGPDEVRRIERRWRQTRSGPTKAGGLLVIDGTEASLVRMGLSIGAREMGLADLRKQLEARILSALDVPPVLVGSVVGLEMASYSNMGQARMQFHEESTGPMLERVCAALTHSLAPEYPELGVIRIRPDLSRVMALLEWEDKRRRLALAEHVGGVITKNEARGSVERAPVPGGDYFLDPLNAIKVLPDGTREPPPKSSNEDKEGGIPSGIQAEAPPVSEARVNKLRSALHNGNTPEALRLLRSQAELASPDADSANCAEVALASASSGPTTENLTDKARRLLATVGKLATLDRIP